MTFRTNVIKKKSYTLWIVNVIYVNANSKPTLLLFKITYIDFELYSIVYVTNYISTLKLIIKNLANHGVWFMENMCLRCQHDRPYDNLLRNLMAKNISRISNLLRQVLFYQINILLKFSNASLFSFSYDCPNLHSAFIDKYLWKSWNDSNDAFFPCHDVV